MASGHVNRIKGRTHGRTDQCCTREESPCQLGAVHTWPISTNCNAAKYWSLLAVQRTFGAATVRKSRSKPEVAGHQANSSSERSSLFPIERVELCGAPMKQS